MSLRVFSQHRSFAQHAPSVQSNKGVHMVDAGKTMLFTLAHAKSNKPAFDSNGKPLLNPEAISQVRQTGNRWLPIRRRKYPIRQAGEVHGGVTAMVPTSYLDPSGSYARYGLYTLCIVHHIYIMFPTCIKKDRWGTQLQHN